MLFILLAYRTRWTDFGDKLNIKVDCFFSSDPSPFFYPPHPYSAPFLDLSLGLAIMQNNSLRTVARHSAAASGSRTTTTTAVAAPTRRHFKTSPPTNKAFFLDTLRKTHTPPTSTYKINGAIGTHVSTSPSEELERPTRFLRMIMFGKPGSGKGTLSQRLVKKYDLVSVSTGDLLRQHIAERTDIGREAEKIVASGGLIPDEIVLKVVSKELDGLRNKVRLELPFDFGLSVDEFIDV